jgi:hypothetical protein
MMRLAFCFLSNHEDGLRNLIKNFEYDMNAPPYIIESYSKNILVNPPLQPDIYIHEWNVEWRRYESSPTIDMFSMRQDSLAMARNADVIYIGDDDMRFEEGSSEVINECCQYMDEHQDCGAIYLCGTLGGLGTQYGEEIVVANDRHLSLNRGILVRNRSEILDNRLHALGANFEFIVGFTCLLDGLYVARRFHVPIQHLTKNIMKEGHENLFYDLDFIRNRGIVNRVNDVIGKWNEHVIWPENLFRLYRQEAMKKGFLPMYHADGEIICA